MHPPSWNTIIEMDSTSDMTDRTVTLFSDFADVVNNPGSKMENYQKMEKIGEGRFSSIPR